MFIGQNIFCTISQYIMTLALMAVRQKVNTFESSVVVQELEFAMNLALYGLSYSLMIVFGWTLRGLTNGFP